MKSNLQALPAYNGLTLSIIVTNPDFRLSFLNPMPNMADAWVSNYSQVVEVPTLERAEKYLDDTLGFMLSNITPGQNLAENEQYVNVSFCRALNEVVKVPRGEEMDVVKNVVRNALKHSHPVDESETILDINSNVSITITASYF